MASDPRTTRRTALRVVTACPGAGPACRRMPGEPAGERAELRAWLHDTTLQVLEYLASGLHDEDPAELRRVAARAADELRAFVEDRTPAPSAGLVERLSAVVEEQAALAGHQVVLVPGVADGDADQHVAQALASATREALTNVRKHARATRATVFVEVADGVATVTVADDGQGFDPSAVRTGVGLRESLAGRLARCGGQARVTSRQGAGTVVTLIAAAHGATAGPRGAGALEPVAA